jgi:hypothetical protein
MAMTLSYAVNMSTTPTVQPSPCKASFTFGHACCCSWVDCAALRRKFFEEEDPYHRGSICFKEDLYGDDERSTTRRRAYLKNLNVTTKKYEELTRNGGPLYVARHHFSREQLTLFTSKRQSRSKPLLRSEISLYTSVIDDYGSFTNNKGKRVYFHLPNYPRGQLDIDIKVLSSPRTPRSNEFSRKRNHSLAEAEQRIQEEEHHKKKQAFATMSYEEFEEILAHKQKLQQDNQEKDAVIIAEREAKEKVQRELLTMKVKHRRNSNCPAPPANINTLNTEVTNGSSTNLLVNALLELYGGVSRMTLFSDQWHEKNKYAANHFFGFRNWSETVMYCLELFPDLKGISVTSPVQLVEKARNTINLHIDDDSTTGKATRVKYNKLEHCLIAKIYMHSIPIRRRLSMMFAISEAHCGRIIKEWLPRWGKAGEQLAILIINDEYLDKELPAEYKRLGLEKVAALLDGKDYLLQVIRKDDKKRRSQMSSKMHAAAGRDITWTTPGGLCFEFTKMFGGRISEQKLVELWGKLGCHEANIQEWRNWGIDNADVVRTAKTNGLKMETAIDEMDIELLLDNLEVESSNDDVSDSIDFMDVNDQDIIIDNGGDLAGEGPDATMDLMEESQSESQSSSQQSIIEPATEKAIAAWTKLMKGRREEYRTRKTIKDLEKNNAFECKISPYVDSGVQYEKEALKALESGPQSGPLELLLQLELHERLYRLYEKETLSPCLLSFYVDTMKEYRWTLLDWLGSDLTPQSHYGMTVVPPVVPIRLHKIPVGREVLGDKGFDGCDRFHPNMNPIRTPLLLRTRKIKQYLREEITGKGCNRGICRLRYTSEVAFSRVTKTDGLKDVIRYANIPVLQHIHSWGHAMINLDNPLRQIEE